MKKCIYHFAVGNGNCSVIEVGKDFLMVVDLNHSVDFESTYDMLKPFFRISNDGKECIDVLLITHGHLDHCKDFKKFREKIDSGDLLIGTILHQGYDRREYEDESELEDDYIALAEEIDRRKKSGSTLYGDLEQALVAGADIDKPSCIAFPYDLIMNILNPSEDDLNKEDFDSNNLSCVVKMELTDLGGMLFTGDSESKAWQESIIPNILAGIPSAAESNHLIVAHHGSYTFFGADRDAVREADPYPDNYESLNYIKPRNIVISAESKFPTSKDMSGDNPPHYAAWKWYHKWFRVNRGVSESDKHPDSFLYSSEGNIKLEYELNRWTIDRNYDLQKERQKRELGKEMAQKLKKNKVTIGTISAVPSRAYRIDLNNR